eukprot:TRINITY_DN19956_c0_g1_i1.p1 TRINITY_DN19956_c0_g1~~TRINITY_DN19956_c0_g1_i1.p1  ORF type:complete len:157 (-),score=45.91 TRINITY_DN19956_c0_g1_i1:74-493(-)
MALTSYISGALFAAAWWLFVDGWVVYSKDNSGAGFDFVMWLPGLLGTLGFVMINMTTPSDLSNSSAVDFDRNPNTTKICFFFSVLVAFISIIAAIWILADKSMGKGWPGIALILQSILLLGSGLAFWFGRGPKKDEFGF